MFYSVQVESHGGQGVRLEAFPSLPAGDRAWITDEKGETSVPGLYAAGDCCGGILLAHHASAQARRIVQSWLGEKVPALAATPSVLYTKPEVASVGLSLAEAQHIYPNAVERKWMLGNMGRYLVEYPEENGLLKLVYLPEEERLLGIHLCGGPAGELITTAAYLLALEVPFAELSRITLPHPTIAEIFHLAFTELADEKRRAFCKKES